MCDRVLFSLNKEFSRYFDKKKTLHFRVKIVCLLFFFFCLFFLEFSVFLRIFWSGVVGAIDVAEHVANMLS